MWRPILSTYRNHYKALYSFAGRFLSMCSREFFADGSATDSIEQVMAKIADFNEDLAEFPPEPIH